MAVPGEGVAMALMVTPPGAGGAEAEALVGR